MDIDFYCLPSFLAANRPAVVALVEAVLTRIEQSDERPSPCRMLFSGVDRAEDWLVRELGLCFDRQHVPIFHRRREAGLSGLRVGEDFVAVLGHSDQTTNREIRT